jgi:5'-3' exonuclease
MTVTMYLDAPSLVYRAFFAVPKTITDGSGEPVNAVRGFMDMTSRLKVEWGPDEVVAVFDNDWRPAFRVDAYSGYKAERPEEPEELTKQFEMLPRILDLAGIPRAEGRGYEADDVIATYAAATDGDDRAIVVTGDRDLLCLVRDPHVRLVFPVKGVSQVKEFREADVAEAYGVKPQLYCDFAMLRGDNSDGLPGVKGVGPKTAVKLLDDHGSIDAIYEHLDELSPRMRVSFEDARDYLRAMEDVVPPRKDVPIEATASGSADSEALMTFAAAHNLDGPATRLLEAFKPGAAG